MNNEFITRETKAGKKVKHPVGSGKGYKKDYSSVTEQEWTNLSFKDRKPLVNLIKKREFKGTEEEARKTITSDDISHWVYGEVSTDDLMQDADSYKEAYNIWIGMQKVEKLKKHIKVGKKTFSWKQSEDYEAYERSLNMKGYNVYDAYPGGDTYVIVYTKLDLPKADKPE